MVLVSNDVYRLSSLGGFGTRARITDGVLGVVSVTVDRGTDLAALVAAEARRRIDGFPATGNGPHPSSASTPASRCSTSASTARRCDSNHR